MLKDGLMSWYHWRQTLWSQIIKAGVDLHTLVKHAVSRLDTTNMIGWRPSVLLSSRSNLVNDVTYLPDGRSGTRWGWPRGWKAGPCSWPGSAPRSRTSTSPPRCPALPREHLHEINSWNTVEERKSLHSYNKSIHKILFCLTYEYYLAWAEACAQE